MDQLQTRLDALEHQLQTLTHHTHTITRRLRWWRGLACGLLGLAVLTWALPAGTAPEDTIAGSGKEQKGLEQRVAALESLLKHFSRKDNEVTIKGANLHLVNSLGSTDCFDEQGEIPDCPNGLGNLIVGYNELRASDPTCSSELVDCEDRRTGSHNVVVGQFHNFSRFGGLVVGDLNEISGDFATVSGGRLNQASGEFAVVSGGIKNTASAFGASVSGGNINIASASIASVSVLSALSTQREQWRGEKDTRREAQAVQGLAPSVRALSELEYQSAYGELFQQYQEASAKGRWVDKARITEQMATLSKARYGDGKFRG